MNITSQTAEKVRNDYSANEARDSALQRYEDEAQEKRRQQNKKTVEIDVKQAINQSDNRIGNYSKTEVGSGTIVGDHEESNSPDAGQRSSVAKRSSPRKRHRLSNNRRDLSSTHTLDVDDNMANHRSLASGIEKIDPMLKIATKEHSTSGRQQLRNKRSGLESQTPSIIDLSYGNTNTQIAISPIKNTSSKKISNAILNSKLPNMDLIEDVSRASHNLTNELYNTNTGFMPQEEELEMQQHTQTDPRDEPPNSPAQGNINILQNTTVGFHRGGQEIEPFMILEQIPGDLPQTSRYQEEADQNHNQLMLKQSPLIKQYSKHQQSTLTAAFNPNATQNTNFNQSPQPHSMIPAQAARFNQLGTSSLNQPMSDEQRFKSDRTGISKNSFERASKTYYLHQQKMLKKEQAKQKMMQQAARGSGGMQSKNSSGEYHDGFGGNMDDAIIDIDQMGSQMIKNEGEEIIMHDSKDKNNAHTVIVRHRASREEQSPSPRRTSRMSPANQFQNMVVYDKNEIGINEESTPPLSPIAGATIHDNSNVSTIRNHQGGSQMMKQKMNATGNVWLRGTNDNSDIRVTQYDEQGNKQIDPSSMTSRSKFSHAKSSNIHNQTKSKGKFYSTARQSPQPQSYMNNTQQTGNQDQSPLNAFQQHAMVIGRPANIVPIVSKMKKVNLLNKGTPQMGHYTVSDNQDIQDISQHSFKGSPRQQAMLQQEYDAANSSVKTFDSPNVRLVPRPLNFVYQIQQEREMHQLATADGATSGNASLAIKSLESKENTLHVIKAQYSTDEQVTEEVGNLDGTLRINSSQMRQYAMIGADQALYGQTDSAQPQIVVSNLMDDNGNVMYAGKGRVNQQKQGSASNILNLKKMGHENPQWTINHNQRNNSSKSNKKKHNQNNVATASRTKVNLKNKINYENSNDDRSASAKNFDDRQNQGSVMSNVGTLKPPSPTPPLDPKSAEISEILESDLANHQRNQSAETRQYGQQAISTNNEYRSIVESSDDSTTHFIELPNNPFLQANYLLDGTDKIEITPEEEIVRQTDPETFLYLVLLKKMKQNPNANVTSQIKKEIISDKDEDFGQLKPLLYKKAEKQDKGMIFKHQGVIHEESFQFDEMHRRRSEYVNYCINKIKAAIVDEEMDENDAKHSPLNVQISSSKRRQSKTKMLQESLRTKYGITFQENPNSTLRLANGLSTVELNRTKGQNFSKQSEIQKYGLQTDEDVRKFEELNGIKITPDYDNLNEQSMDLLKTVDLPKLSYTSWNIKDLQSTDGLKQITNEPQSAKNFTKGGITNFNFQTKKSLVETSQRALKNALNQQNQATMKEPLSRMLNIRSGELSQASLHMTSPGFFAPIEQDTRTGKKSRNDGVFKNRMLSLAPPAVNQTLQVLDEQSSAGANMFGRKSSYPVVRSQDTKQFRSRGVHDYFSTHQRFHSVFGTSGEYFQRSEVSKHNNPKFIEIIAKLRDPSLNADFMEKSVIRPEVAPKLAPKKMDQQQIDQHLKKINKSNQGCPLIPIHKLEPIYANKMQDVLKEPSTRPKEKNWQQIGVMLPILRQGASKNIIRNTHLDIDPTQEMLNNTKVLQSTLHSPSQLTSPNINRQHKKTSRSVKVNPNMEGYEHRIKVKDIVAVKAQNDKEILRKRATKLRQDIARQEQLDSKKSAVLASEIDFVAEQMAIDDHVEELEQRHQFELQQQQQYQQQQQLVEE